MLMTGVGFVRLLAGLLTFARPSRSTRRLLARQLSRHSYPSGNGMRVDSSPFPDQFCSAHPSPIRNPSTPYGRPTLDVRHLFGIIDFGNDKGIEMQKLNNEFGMQDKGVIQVFRICSRCNHLWRITPILASGFVSVGCTSDCHH